MTKSKRNHMSELIELGLMVSMLVIGGGIFLPLIALFFYFGSP